MLRDINKIRVILFDNYDANEREPWSCQRASKPLVNGATGIVVGMANQYSTLITWVKPLMQ